MILLSQQEKIHFKLYELQEAAPTVILNNSFVYNFSGSGHFESGIKFKQQTKLNGRYLLYLADVLNFLIGFPISFSETATLDFLPILNDIDLSTLNWNTRGNLVLGPSALNLNLGSASATFTNGIFPNSISCIRSGPYVVNFNDLTCYGFHFNFNLDIPGPFNGSLIGGINSLNNGASNFHIKEK